MYQLFPQLRCRNRVVQGEICILYVLFYLFCWLCRMKYTCCFWPAIAKQRIQARFHMRIAEAQLRDGQRGGGEARPWRSRKVYVVCAHQ